MLIIHSGKKKEGRIGGGETVNFAVTVSYFHKFRATRLYSDNKAVNKCGRWIKSAAKLDCSQAQWNPLHALMHSCASRMPERAGNENTHCNHCGYIRFHAVYIHIPFFLSRFPLRFAIYSLACAYVRACVCVFGGIP